MGKLAQEAGLAAPRVRVVAHSQPNAWAMGLVPSRSTVLVTSALVSKLTRDELAAVLAHELAHIRSRDSVLMTTVAAVAVCLTGLATVLDLLGIMVGRSGWAVRLMGGAVASSSAFLAASLSWDQEYRADESGVAICGHPEWLIAALRKLNRQTRRGSAHDPIAGRAHASALFIGADVNTLFDSHPPICNRIARLEHLMRGDEPRSR